VDPTKLNTYFSFILPLIEVDTSTPAQARRKKHLLSEVKMSTLQFTTVERKPQSCIIKKKVKV
jgi:hypothetical protein